MPRFKVLKKEDQTPRFTDAEDHQNFLWFQTAHDFTTPSMPEVEQKLRAQILKLTIRDIKI